MTKQFQCVKCGNHEYEKEEISTNGGALSRFFDVSNKRFVAFSCTSANNVQGDLNIRASFCFIAPFYPSSHAT